MDLMMSSDLWATTL